MEILIKRLFLYLFGAFIWSSAQSQVIITINQSSPLNAKVSDLFNAGLNNTTTNVINLYLVGSIIDTRNGQELVSAKTDFIDCQPGFTQLSESVLMPLISYSNLSIQQSGMLPFGNFKYCLKAFSKAVSEPLGDGCMDVDNIPLSPPLLISPSNTEEIHLLNPLLIWLAPSPLNPRLEVMYDLKLVEIMQNQTPYDATDRNFAIMEATDLKTTTMQYPANAIALEDTKSYAWRIIAKSSEGNVIGQTETWSFTIKLPKDNLVEEPKVNRNFIRLGSQPDAESVLVKDELKLIYEERYGKTNVTISIKDMSDKVVYSLEVAVDKGENRIVINLKDIGVLKDKIVYRVQASAAERPLQQLTIKNIR